MSSDARPSTSNFSVSANSGADTFEGITGRNLTPNSESDSTLRLANGRELSVKLLPALLQHIVQEKKLTELSRGLEYRVYTSPELDGAVFKLASTAAAHSPLIMHPLHPEPAQAFVIAKELMQNGYAVPFVRIPITIPVQSVRTGDIREERVELIVQRSVLAIENCWKSSRNDSTEVAKLGQDLATFHRRLIAAGYLDADLNCIKNVGYDSLDQSLQELRLIDLGFVYRLPTDRAGRASALASYGDSTHTTLGEFLAGGIFDRFYQKALKDKSVQAVFTKLVRELFPGLTTSEMRALVGAYAAINKELRSTPANEIVRTYIDRIRAPENAELIQGVLAKLCDS